MWAIDNQTPFRVGRTWGRDQEGRHEWIVAVKGTFDIRADGSLELAAEQLDPLIMPEYNGEPGASSLRYDADLVASKPTTDVLLNGTAYAPGGRPSTGFMIELKVGPIQKVLKVVGNRRWDGSALGLRLSAIEPITQLPIVYERAYGGYDRDDPDPMNQRIDLRNPVGCGVVAETSHRLGRAVPNFEYPERGLEQAGPAGFGAIDSFWSPRLEQSGTYDEAWRAGRYPLPPADWDPRCLLSAPADQLPDRDLRGGELVELKNLTPGGILRFHLPKIYLRFRTLIDGVNHEHDGRLASVIIEPDHPRVIMVWQSSLSVGTNGDYLDETTVSEKVRLE
jgi:hypothetical protein